MRWSGGIGRPGGPRRLAAVAIGLAIIPAALAADGGPSRSTEAIVRALRDQSRKVNGFTAELSVRAGGASQSGTLLFLAPDRLRMEMKVARLGEQKIVSDGRVLWTITPQARLATKIDLEVVRRSWGRPLPNQAMAIRDVFEVVKPGTVRFVREEAVRGVMTRLFEAVPEPGVDPGPGAALPDRMRAWVGSDGLLRRQVLMRGDEVLMDARFRITDRNPRIRPGQFRFEPPPDYQVQDLTESTLEALRSLAAGRT